MTMHYKTSAFVFKKEDRLEADRVFSVFTKDFGRIEILGKAIRKINSKLRSGIEVFSLSEIEFIQGRNQKTLTDAVFTNKFNNLTTEPERMLLAFKISDILENFLLGQEADQRIWNIIVDIFEKLNDYSLSPTHYSLIYYYFFWNFISVLGYEPNLSECVVCRQKLNPYQLYFSGSDGGTLCKNCYQFKKDVIKLKSDIVKILRIILKKDWDTLFKIKIDDNHFRLFKEITDYYYRYLSSRKVTQAL